ncbi:MAG: VWA domain-containing protein [Halopseudomonas yangmingensis]|uniref:Ca-activated chloride channel family protein n=1 Tax=Halopseudomonas yangmingensis TaxID=1720063 RepID=A0A1I4SPL0_9GAMM|nr:VWA domain-containing protein [Halopseudomonas yangmingensis]SFM66424.1 Ca-activated chloride channel family protein [Halopseudomonas yangmingensis]
MPELHWPWIFLLAPLPWLLRKLLPAAATDAPALQVSFIRRLQQLPQTHRGISQHINPGRRWPLLLIWFLLLLAAARPHWLGDPLTPELSGRDMLLAVDLSGSMTIHDMQLDGQTVDRLTLVKSLLDTFIQQRHGDRLGLILFGTQAYVQAPLTLDHDSVRTWLDETFIGLAGQQTAIGDAIGLAIRRLHDQPSSSRTLILITDGANTSGSLQPRQAAQMAAENNVRIFTIGVGSHTASSNTSLLAFSGDPSIDLDEPALRDIAAITGGEYFRATDNQSMTAIYRRLDQLEPALRADRPRYDTRPLQHWPLGLALLISLGLAITRLRPEQLHA